MGLGDGELELAEEMAAALAAGDISSAELVARSLSRADEWQPHTNAFSQLWPEDALEAARAADRARAQGDRRPLLGIPVAVKDLFDVAGRETTGCCAAYAGRVAEGDSPAVAALARAGLVLVGKTNQHELAAGGTNLVSACGPTANPWDPSRMTGGSSGGSAAAVAAGVVPWALGSDTGGSIRIPSSLCGTVGLKPTTGALSIDGMLPLAPSLDCPGPLAAAVSDAATLFAVLARRPGPAPPEAPARSRVGVPGGFFADTVHPEVLAAVRTVASALAEAGVEVVELDGRGIEDARSVWSRACWSEFGPAHPALADPGRRALVGPSVREWIERGEALSDAEREEVRRRRGEIAEWFADRLAGLDALLVPTTPYPAPRATEEQVELEPGRSVRVDRVGPGYLTCSVNLAGLPAVSVPAGRSSEGLPLGVSFVGREDGEDAILALARGWERASGEGPRRPSLPAA